MRLLAYSIITIWPLALPAHAWSGFGRAGEMSSVSSSDIAAAPTAAAAAAADANSASNVAAIVSESNRRLLLKKTTIAGAGIFSSLLATTPPTMTTKMTTTTTTKTTTSPSSLPLPPSAAALDMDAFVDRELQADSNTKKMSNDEALCKFGMPSKQAGDACIRAGIPTKRKDGGVDAYGNVDRGTFVRCTTSYLDTGNEYKKVVTCK